MFCVCTLGIDFVCLAAHSSGVMCSFWLSAATQNFCFGLELLRVCKGPRLASLVSTLVPPSAPNLKDPEDHNARTREWEFKRRGNNVNMNSIGHTFILELTAHRAESSSADIHSDICEAVNESHTDPPLYKIQEYLFPKGR